MNGFIKVNYSNRKLSIGGKMNVLVYTGPGTSGSAVRHTLKTLKRLLGECYDVLSVSDPKILSTNVWRDSTALLVVPGGRDVPYVRSLGPEGAASISAYVRDGGKYLGLWCAFLELLPVLRYLHW